MIFLYTISGHIVYIFFSESTRSLLLHFLPSAGQSTEIKPRPFEKKEEKIEKINFPMVSKHFATNGGDPSTNKVNMGL